MKSPDSLGYYAHRAALTTKYVVQGIAREIYREFGGVILVVGVVSLLAITIPSIQRFGFWGDCDASKNPPTCPTAAPTAVALVPTAAPAIAPASPIAAPPEPSTPTALVPDQGIEPPTPTLVPPTETAVPTPVVRTLNLAPDPIDAEKLEHLKETIQYNENAGFAANYEHGNYVGQNFEGADRSSLPEDEMLASYGEMANLLKDGIHELGMHYGLTFPAGFAIDAEMSDRPDGAFDHNDKPTDRNFIEHRQLPETANIPVDGISIKKEGDQWYYLLRISAYAGNAKYIYPTKADAQAHNLETGMSAVLYFRVPVNAQNTDMLRSMLMHPTTTIATVISRWSTTENQLHNARQSILETIDTLKNLDRSTLKVVKLPNGQDAYQISLLDLTKLSSPNVAQIYKIGKSRIVDDETGASIVVDDPGGGACGGGSVIGEQLRRYLDVLGYSEEDVDQNFILEHNNHTKRISPTEYFFDPYIRGNISGHGRKWNDWTYMVSDNGYRTDGILLIPVKFFDFSMKYTDFDFVAIPGQKNDRLFSLVELLPNPAYRR